MISIKHPFVAICFAGDHVQSWGIPEDPRVWGIKGSGYLPDIISVEIPFLVPVHDQPCPLGTVQLGKDKHTVLEILVEAAGKDRVKATPQEVPRYFNLTMSEFFGRVLRSPEAENEMLVRRLDADNTIHIDWVYDTTDPQLFELKLVCAA